MDFNQHTLSKYLSLVLRWQNPLSLIITLGCLTMAGWMFGQLIWLIPAQNSVSMPWSPQPVVRQASAPTTDITALQASHLFGVYNPQAAPVVAPPVQVDAPQTRLNLTLVGVVASNDDAFSLAVIANRGQQATYGLNEQIEGTRVTLKAVFADRVIIDNAGRDETLMLDGVDYEQLTIQSPASQLENSAVNESMSRRDVESKLSAIRSAIRQNPREIFQYVSLSQVKQDEQIIGYRVSAGRDPALFEAVGLQNGDIAVQLNGLDLTESSAMTQIFQAVNDLTELNLTVDRDGQQYDIYIQF